MIDLALDPKTGDLAIANFDLQLVRDVDQIAQNLSIRLRFMLGEWYLNTLAGIPYYQYFLIKNPNQIQVESFLKDEIGNTGGVEEITSFSSDFDGLARKFTVTFGVKTIDGTLQMEQDLP